MTSLVRKVHTAARLARGDFIPAFEPAWGEADENALAGRGAPDAVAEVERRLIALGVGEPFLLDSGRQALVAGLGSLPLDTRKEVIVPSYGCLGMALPIIAAGLKPVFVDVDEDFGMSGDAVEAAISPVTRAVLLPHLYGFWPKDAERIVELARAHRIAVVDDAAQAFGLRHRGRAAGTLGEVGVFSCGPGKPLFGAAGGLLVTRAPLGMSMGRPRAQARERLTALHRQFASRATQGRALLRATIEPSASASADPPTIPGIEAMAPADAALTLSQMDAADHAARRRLANVDFWRSAFAERGLPYRLPRPQASVATKCPVVAPDEAAAARLSSTLWRHGIQAEGAYAPLHKRVPFTAARRLPLPTTEALARTTVLVPVSPVLSELDRLRIERALHALSI